LAIGSDSKKPNISETVRETFTKLSGFLEVISIIPHAKYGGDLTTQFWGKGCAWRDLNETWHKYSSSEWALLKGFQGQRMVSNHTIVK